MIFYSSDYFKENDILKAISLINSIPEEALKYYRKIFYIPKLINIFSMEKIIGLKTN